MNEYFLKRVYEEKDRAERKIRGLGPQYRGTPIEKALREKIERLNNIIKKAGNE